MGREDLYNLKDEKSKGGHGKKKLTILFCVPLIFGLTASAHLQNRCSHGLTIKVRKMSKIAFTGEAVTHTIPDVFSGLESSNSNDHGSCHLRWVTTQPGIKITVATDKVYARSKLQVRVLNCNGGLSTTGSVTITSSDQVFMTSMSPSDGSCDLKYNVTSQAIKRANTEIHGAVYTMTDIF
jgi:hypothetical protein